MKVFILTAGVLFVLIFVSFKCEGKVYPPPGGNKLTFASGSTARIEWSFDDNMTRVDDRIWRFTSSNDSSRAKLLARVYRNREMYYALPGVAIEKPATLVLEKVDQSYNGTFRFTLHAANMTPVTSDVFVYVKEKPTVTVSCSSPIIVTEGDTDVTCVCRGECGDECGNLAANVTWYKDGVQIGKTEEKEQTLTLNNVDRSDSGTYKCVTQSGTLTNEKSIEILVCRTRAKNVSNTKSPKKVEKDVFSEWYIFFIMSVPGIIIGLFLAYIASCARRRWFGNRKPERNLEEPAIELDSKTYDDVKVSRMNSVNNYGPVGLDAGDTSEPAYVNCSTERDADVYYVNL